MEVDNEEKSVYHAFDDIDENSWKKLSEKKIFFGHQSVGMNIIDGIKDLMKENPAIQLNIVETSVIGAEKGGVFAHAYIGKNEDPKAKIDDFSNIIQNNLGENVDVVILKFCYVDITENTDAQKLFNEYREKMSVLKQKFVKLQIVHVTSPLTAIQSGSKAWIKKLIGRTLGGVKDNIVRNEFNQLIRNHYIGKETVYDLAVVESTKPDGSRTVFQSEGTTYNAMTSEYTPDRGHLNKTGRKRAAKELLLKLVNLN